jgi:hypothetical protein
MSAGLPRDQRAIAALTGFTDYRDSFHIGGFPAAVVDEADTWEPTTNALRFVAGDYSSEWSYNGDTMHLTVASPQLSYDLRLTGAGHVMYVKDKLGIKGFIQSLDFRALRSLSVWRPRGPWLATELGSAGPTGFTISVTQRTLRNLGKSGFQRQNQSLITSRCYSDALVLLRRRG